MALKAELKEWEHQKGRKLRRADREADPALAAKWARYGVLKELTSGGV